MKRRAAGEALQPGDLTLAEDYIRAIIDSDAGRRAPDHVDREQR